MEKLFRHLHMPYELACEFLAVFARFEYALKAAGYFKRGQRRAEADWERFAGEINNGFLSVENVDFIRAKEYLLENPPRKQVVENNFLCFVDVSIDSNKTIEEQVLSMVRIVRNNLFHGGKYNPEVEVEMGRSTLLVEYSIRILLECYNLKGCVRDRFEM